MLINAASKYSDNPRDLKRFMNVYRFHYFLMVARRKKGLKAPSPDQLRRWIFLSLKWPDMVRWLQWGSKILNDSAAEEQDSSGRSASIVKTRERLLLLEKITKDANTLADWRGMIGKVLGLNETTMVRWAGDEELYDFFRSELNLDTNDRLSSSAGLGFY